MKICTPKANGLSLRAAIIKLGKGVDAILGRHPRGRYELIGGGFAKVWPEFDGKKVLTIEGKSA